MKKLITMIAGPNGAGKTTAAYALISRQKGLYDEFLNADEIARGLAPLHPESVPVEASKLMLKRFHNLLELKKSFIFETTASQTASVAHLEEARLIGYELNLLFLWLPSADQAVQRVANRVKQGGHNIPEDRIRKRYRNGLKNLVMHYLPLVDTALIIDNSLAELDQNKVIARKDQNGQLRIEDEKIWENLWRAAHG